MVEVLAAESDGVAAPHRRLGPAPGGRRLALRFPRFTGRWREDKTPTDATTVAEVVEMFRTARRAPTGS